MHSLGLFTIIALISSLHVSFGVPTKQGKWTPLANITVAPRQEHTTVFLPPSTIAILGGIVPDGDSIATTDLVQSYSIPDNTWKTVAPVPRPINHVNAAVVNGKIYVLGALADASDGSRSWTAVGDSWLYNPESNRWNAIPPMPPGQEAGSAAVGVYDGKIFLAGGMKLLELEGERRQDTVDTVSVYDTKSSKWLDVPEAAKRVPGRRDHAGAAVVGNKFYVLGGRNRGQVNVKDEVFILDLRNIEKGWTTSSARMPTARGGVAAGRIGNKVYTFGGEGNQQLESGVFNETEVYDAVRDSWEKLVPMRVPRHGSYAVGVGKDVYVPGGGLLFGGAPTAYFDKFTP
ncbi:galactose oxidase [Westerdykella ornata]|uniref:Galactose oxidase n=1 Tax=Westerdykella ornata TaxID=318751 RepID=A0A6A6JNG7_WESOR|nr:galactose oxidase [Westerdykella ornata]KAF2278161.1 galactose oxidase [Westerdykella ornata]